MKGGNLPNLEAEVLQIISSRKLRNFKLYSHFRPVLHLCFSLSEYRKDLHCCRNIDITQWQRIWYQVHAAFPKPCCTKSISETFRVNWSKFTEVSHENNLPRSNNHSRQISPNENPTTHSANISSTRVYYCVVFPSVIHRQELELQCDTTVVN